MNLPIQIAETRLLLPAGLDAGGLERTFGTLLGPGVDFGDLYFQHARRESWTVEDGIVKDGAHSIEQGVGVCGKDGQSVPVGVGQPSLLIDQITVGGTQA